MIGDRNDEVCFVSSARSYCHDQSEGSHFVLFQVLYKQGQKELSYSIALELRMLDFRGQQGAE